MEIKYYEIVMRNRKNPQDEYSICIKAKRKPSKFEAEQFLFNDMQQLGYTHVTRVIEISHEEALSSFDMENEDKFPVFGA